MKNFFKLVATIGVAAVGAGSLSSVAMPNPLTAKQWKIVNSIKDANLRSQKIYDFMQANPWNKEWFNRKNSQTSRGGVTPLVGFSTLENENVSSSTVNSLPNMISGMSKPRL